MVVKMNSRKRKLSVEGTSLNQFEGLRSDQAKVRIKSSGILAENLCRAEVDVKELSYAIKRLVRGLGAEYNFSRTGFYTALVTVLRFGDQTKMSVQQVLDVMNRELNGSDNTCHVLLGRILCCEALLRAGRIQAHEVMDTIIEAAQRKKNVRLVGYMVLAEHISQLNLDDLRKQIRVIEDRDLDWIFISTHAMGDEVDKDRVLTEFVPLLANMDYVDLKHPVYGLLCERVAAISDSALSDFLKACEEQILLPKLATDTSIERNPLMRYLHILTECFDLPNPKQVNIVLNAISSNTVRAILETYADGTPFERAKVKKRYIGLDDVFRKFCSKLIKYVNTNVECGKVVNKKTTPSKSHLRISALVELLTRMIIPKLGGSCGFDQVTRSNLASTLLRAYLGQANLKATRTMANMVFEVLAASDKGEGGGDKATPYSVNNRVHAGFILVKILTHTTKQTDANADECLPEWKYSLLKRLLQLGATQTNNEKGPDRMGTMLRHKVIDMFFSGLDQKWRNLHELHSVQYRLLLEVDKEGLYSRNSSQEVQKAYQQLQKLNSTLSKVKGADNAKAVSLNLIFAILFEHLLLQHLHSQRCEMAIDALSDLMKCCERIKDTENKRKSLANTDADTPEWHEVLMDVFMSLLSHESALLRRIINIIFPYLCPYLSESTLHQIFDVLDPESNNEIFIGQNGGDDEDSDYEENDDDGNKNKSQGFQHKASNKNDGDDEEDDDADDDDDDDDEELEVDEGKLDSLRMALQQTLLKNGQQNNDNDAESCLSMDVDAIDSDEGERLNGALAEVFRAHGFSKNQTQAKKKRERKVNHRLAHFRTRVLDLVDILIREAGRQNAPQPFKVMFSTNITDVLVPLLRLYAFCMRDKDSSESVGLMHHISNILQTLAKYRSSEGVCSENMENLIDTVIGLLNEILDASKYGSTPLASNMSEPISSACLFLIRHHLAISGTNQMKLENAIGTCLAQHLTEFLHSSTSIVPFQLFQHILRSNVRMEKIIFDHLAPVLYEGMGAAFKDNENATEESQIRLFRCNQLTHLLIELYANNRVWNSLVSLNSEQAEHTNEQNRRRSTPHTHLHLILQLHNAFIGHLVDSLVTVGTQHSTRVLVFQCKLAQLVTKLPSPFVCDDDKRQKLLAALQAIRSQPPGGKLSTDLKMALKQAIYALNFPKVQPTQSCGSNGDTVTSG